MPENDRLPAARIPGLDLGRTVSMVMVIVLHILGQGGILEASQPGSMIWYASWGLECLCYCAADCYGLLSGYLGAGRRRPCSRLALLWLEVVLYSLLYYALFRLRMPEVVGQQALIRALFPVLKRQYWYFTGYFGLSLLIPLFSSDLEKVDSRRATGAVFLLLSVFCLFPTIFASDAFQFRGGYTLLWLLFLYLMGAMLRCSGFFHRLGILPLLLTALFCAVLTFYTHLNPVSIPGLSSFTLLDYTSPSVVALAVCLVLLFRRIPVKGLRGRRLLSGLAQTSFGVYILHTNPLLWRHLFVPGCLAGWASLRTGALVLLVPTCALGAYLLLSAADYARLRLFRLLRLQGRLEAWEERFFGGDRTGADP